MRSTFTLAEQISDHFCTAAEEALTSTPSTNAACAETSRSCIKLMKLPLEKNSNIAPPRSHSQKIKDDSLQKDSSAPPAEAHM